MSLHEIKKNLYKNNAQSRAHEKTIYNPTATEHIDAARLGEESLWQKQERTILERTWRSPLLRIASTFAVILLLAFAAWTFITVRSNLFSAQNVILSIDGPMTVKGGMVAQYVVRYANNNAVTLNEATLTIDHTAAFVVDAQNGVRNNGDTETIYAIGTIEPHEEREIIIKGRFEDIPSGTIYIEPKLTFVPSTTGKAVERTQRLGFMQGRDTLQLTVDAQKSVSSGGIIEYIVRYVNNATEPYEDVSLIAQFPQGFTISSAQPESDADGKTWSIGTIAPNTEGEIRIRGTLSGVLDDVKMAVFTMAMGSGGDRAVLAREEWTTHIAPSALIITQRVNGQESYVAHAGEILTYTLLYSNTSDLGMRDVVVRLKFDDRILDYTRLRLSQSGGSLDAETRSVVWRASDIPELALLAPGQSGRIKLSIPVRDTIPVRDANDRNLTISTTAEIDSPDVPTPIGENKVITSNTLLLKLESPVQFTEEGFYDDFTLKNTGPVPPVVNVKTTFTIRWTVTNATNALANAKVESFLPTSVSWEGVTFPETETIQFNPRTHKIVWQIGDIENGVGIFRKKREVRFQVSITPTINQVGENVPLINEAIFSARDTFTGTEIKIKKDKKTTSLSEDPSVKGGVVQP